MKIHQDIQTDETGKYTVEVFEAENPKAVILCVAGFGMNRYDGHKLFLDVANSLPDYTSILVDLNQIEDGALTASPLSVQVGRFNTALVQAHEYGLPVVLVGHSMGCIVISQGQTTGEPTAFLAPAVRDIRSKLRQTLLARPQTVEKPDGSMLAKRSDGSITTVPKQFWDEAKDLDLKKLYTQAIHKLPIHLMIAGEDELLKVETHDILDLPFASQLVIEGADHDFSGEQRAELLRQLHILLSKVVHNE